MVTASLPKPGRRAHLPRIWRGLQHFLWLHACTVGGEELPLPLQTALPARSQAEDWQGLGTQGALFRQQGASRSWSHARSRISLLAFWHLGACMQL